MKFKKLYQNQKGFSVLFLNILFVIATIVLLIYGLLSNADILASLGVIFER